MNDIFQQKVESYFSGLTENIRVIYYRRKGDGVSNMQSKAEEAYQIIKHKIIMLEMRPTSDVSEEELIQELGISRTPIREAIQRLAKDRFVIIYPRKGTIVADISMDLINCISEVRLLYEPYMARETVMQTSDEWIHKMKEGF